MAEKDLKKASAELLILSLLDARPRHGYELCKLVETLSGGVVRFHVASLYPMLYRMEGRGWVKGRWVEKPNERRKRYYRITGKGRKILAAQRRSWRDFFDALDRVAQIRTV